MKPEPSEVVLCGCRSPPPGPPRWFLKKSSKNSSNGEPGGSFGIVLRSPAAGPPLASTVCEVEMLTTASITFSATSAMPSGPRACAGCTITTQTAPRQIAASQGRKELSARIAAGISDLSVFSKTRSALLATVRLNGVAAQAATIHFIVMSARQMRQKTGLTLNQAWYL